jgi:hypothetical protein
MAPVSPALRRLVIFVLALAAGASAETPAPVSAHARPQADVAEFLESFRGAWTTGTPEALLPLFAPDAGIDLYYRGSSGPEDDREEYRGASGWRSLQDGVVALLGTGVEVDLDGYETAPVVFGGAPATLVRWRYRSPALLPSLPPEVGVDEVVLLRGRIAMYSRKPDPASQLARARAFDRYLSARATQTARATEAAGGRVSSSPAARIRDGSAIGIWVVGAALCLAGVIALALLKRPPEAP